MAFNLKYYAEGVNRLAWRMRVEIYARDYVGDPVALTLVDPVFRVRTDWESPSYVYVPWMPASGTAYVMDPASLVMADLAVASENDFYMKIYRGAEGGAGAWIEEWTMSILAGPSEQELAAFPGAVAVEGVCGIARLKNVLWTQDDGTLYAGQMSILDGIRSCLNKLPYAMPISTVCEWRTPDMALDDNPLVRTHFDAEVFRTKRGDPIETSTVLSHLLQRFQLTLRQGGTSLFDPASWNVYQDFMLVSSPQRFNYDASGNLVSRQEAWNPAVAATQEDIDWGRPAARGTFITGLKAASIEFLFGPLPNLVRGGDFSLGVRSIAGRDRSRGTGGGAFPGTGRPPTGRGGTRGGVESPTRGRGGTTGRGSTGGRNRSAVGRYERDPDIDDPSAHWSFEGFDEEPPRQVGAGPNGETVARLKPVLSSVETAETDARMARIYQAHYSVIGGEGRQLLMNAFVNLVAAEEENLRRYPFFLRLKIGSKYVQRDGTLTAADTLIKLTGQDIYTGGWYDDPILTEDLPAGTHEVEISIYAPPDVHRVKINPVVSLPSLEEARVTNVSIYLVLGGVLNPASRVVNAVVEDSENLEVRSDLTSVIGDSPLVGDVSALTLDGLTNTETWSIVGESDPAGNGKTLDEIGSQELLRAQRRNIDLHKASFLFEHVMCRPHQVLQLPGGERFRPRAVEYDYGRAVMSGQFSRLRRDGFASLVDTVVDDEVATALSAGGAATGMAVALSDSIENQLSLLQIGVISQTIPAGNIYQIHIRPIGEPIIQAGEKLAVLNENTGKLWYFQSLTDQTETTRTLRVGDFETGEQPVAVASPIPSGSTIVMTQERLLSLVSQTRRAFRVDQELDAVTTLSEDVDGFVFELPVEPLVHDVKRGTRLTIVRRNGDQPGHVSASEDADQDALSIEIQPSYVKASKGDFVKVSGEQRSAELLVSPSEVHLGIRQEREGHALGTLAAEASGTLDTLSTSPLAKSVYIDDELLLTHRDTGYVKKIVVRADETQGSETLRIDSTSFAAGGPFPAGSTLRISEIQSASRIRLLEGEVSILTELVTGEGSSLSELILAVDDLEASFGLHASILSNNGLTAGTNITGTVTSQGATLSSHTSILSNNGLTAGTNITQTVNSHNATISSHTSILSNNGLTTGTNITQSVSANAALINTATSVINANGLTTGTNVYQLATNVGSRIVLAAQVVGSSITSLALMTLSSGATGSALNLSGDNITLTANTGGVIQGNYSAGVSGIKIDLSTGDLEANSGTFRGALDAATGTFAGSVSLGNITIEANGSDASISGFGNITILAAGNTLSLAATETQIGGSAVLINPAFGCEITSLTVSGNFNVTAPGGISASLIQGTLSNATLPLSKLQQGGATSGQFMRWSGVNWAPAAISQSNLPSTIPYKNQSETIANAWTFSSGIVLGGSVTFSGVPGGAASFGGLATSGSTTVGFLGTFPITKRTISGTTGTTGGNAAAINSIAQALAAYGLVTNSIV